MFFTISAIYYYNFKFKNWEYTIIYTNLKKVQTHLGSTQEEPLLQVP